MVARIRHIALSVKDIDATADFYEKAFGLKRSPKSEGPTAYRVYMSDGELNLALLQYKSEVGSGLKNPSEFVGIHHFGDDDFERKFRDPNGIIFDVNWKGWALTSSKVKAKGKTKATNKAKTKAKAASKTKLAAARKKVSKKTAMPKTSKPARRK
jgi:hypothetical protein